MSIGFPYVIFNSESFGPTDNNQPLHNPNNQTINSAMEKVEIKVLTQRSLCLVLKRRRPNLACMVANRSLCGQFSVKEKRQIYGQLLPHNPKKVTHINWSYIEWEQPAK
jgi:hypothetical protein